MIKILDVISKNIEVIQVFTEEECKTIIENIEDNNTKLGLSSQYGHNSLSAYEMSTYDASPEVAQLILTRMDELLSFINYEDGKGYHYNYSFLIKYSPDLKKGMKAHYDVQPFSLSINLNNDYKGGETHLPICNYQHNASDYPIGSGLKFRADMINSWHEAMPVIEGNRYVLIVRIDRKIGFFRYIWKVLSLSFINFIFHKIFQNKLYYND